MHRRAVVRVATLLALLLTLAIALPGAASPVAASGSTINPEAQKVLDVARKQRGDPWVSGSVGPTAFDCSGLVYYSFKQAGLLKRIDVTVEKLNSGQGTMGQLLVNPQLYESLNGVSREMHGLMKDFRANPKKFLHIKLGLF